ncbi:hypothetical protein AGMMS49940_10200 [Spirochaetia bacterium]|nr:hypothetical protein AGMMS49940_10200 [Spirochaetia bacterium]
MYTISMRVKVSSIIAVISILLYAAAIGTGIVRVLAGINERRDMARREFYDLTDIASSVEPREFMQDSFKKAVQDTVLGSKTLQAVIITGPSGLDFAFERSNRAIIFWEAGIPRFRTRFGDSSEPHFAPLRIDGLRNATITAVSNDIDVPSLKPVLVESLFIIVAAILLSAVTLLITALSGKKTVLVSDKMQKAVDKTAASPGVPAAEPTAPVAAEPEALEPASESAAPEAVKPEASEPASEPAVPEAVKPEALEPASEPAVPEAVKPEALEPASEPAVLEAIKPETLEPASEPVVPEAVKPETLEPASEPAVPEAVKPEALEPAVPEAPAPEPPELVSPAENPAVSGIDAVDGDADTRETLDVELRRCSDTEQDLALILMELSPGAGTGIGDDTVVFRTFTGRARQFFTVRELVVERGDRGLSVILPGSSVEEGFAKARQFHDQIQAVLPEIFPNKDDLRIGVSALSGRILATDRLILEASKALERAALEPESPIVAFKSDPEKYRAFVQKQAKKVSKEE